jgi:hypothetical protein
MAALLSSYRPSVLGAGFSLKARHEMHAGAPVRDPAGATDAGRRSAPARLPDPSGASGGSAFGATYPFMSRMYATHWAIIPNLGTDVVLPPLLHMLPIHLAGRVVVGCAILLPVLGTIAYSRATFGTRSAWPLASGLAAYNTTLLLGFLNFVDALVIAVLFATAWITWRDRAPARVMVLTVIGTVALIFCHLMGLVFFYVLIAG